MGRLLYMSSYTITEEKLERAMEKLIKEMVEKGMIQGDPQKILEKVMTGLKEAYKKDGEYPQDILTNPLEIKKLQQLVVCAALETQFEKHPELAKSFNTTDIAKALFDKNEPKDKAKNTLTDFFKKLNELKPDGLRLTPEELDKHVDSLVDNILKRKDQDDPKDDATLAAANKFAQEMADLIFVELYGVTSTGVPLAIKEVVGNPASFPENLVDLGPGKGGSLYDPLDPNSQNVSPEIKDSVKQRFSAIEDVTNAFSDFLSSKNNNIVHQAPGLKAQ